MKIHETITIDRVIDAVQLDDCLGFCVACGETAYQVEPDAREHTCETCGECKVYGAEELLFYLQ